MRGSEDRLLAELFLDLKGRKRKRLDWIAIAERCRLLAQRYRSAHELAEKLGVSDHLIRSILSLLNLPLQVQKMVREGKILYDAAYRLNTLRSPTRQKEVAKVIAGLPSHLQREIIQYAKRYPGANLLQFRKRVTSGGPRAEEIHLVLIPLGDEAFGKLQRFSRGRGVPVQEIVVQALSEFMARAESK